MYTSQSGGEGHSWLELSLALHRCTILVLVLGRVEFSSQPSQLVLSPSSEILLPRQRQSKRTPPPQCETKS